MIFGIGTDLVKTYRIAAIVKNYGDKLAAKILTHNEFLLYKNSTSQVNFLAKRFASKEAIVKALGTGFAQDITFKNIEIINNENGKPTVILDDLILLRVSLPKNHIVHLSISDEVDIAVAFAVLEVY